MQSGTSVDTQLDNSTSIFDKFLEKRKAHEITADELIFKSALVQFFANDDSEPHFTDFLAACPYIPEHPEPIFIDRFRHVCSGLFYLSSDANRLNQLAYSYAAQDNSRLSASSRGDYSGITN